MKDHAASRVKRCWCCSDFVTHTHALLKSGWSGSLSCLLSSVCRYYYSHNTGLQSQNVIYTQASVDDEATVLLDPNKLSEDGTV